MEIARGSRFGNPGEHSRFQLRSRRIVDRWLVQIARECFSRSYSSSRRDLHSTNAAVVPDSPPAPHCPRLGDLLGLRPSCEVNCRGNLPRAYRPVVAPVTLGRRLVACLEDLQEVPQGNGCADGHRAECLLDLRVVFAVHRLGHRVNDVDRGFEVRQDHLAVRLVPE